MRGGRAFVRAAVGGSSVFRAGSVVAASPPVSCSALLSSSTAPESVPEEAGGPGKCSPESSKSWVRSSPSRTSATPPASGCAAPSSPKARKHGDSIAVNGVCLTVVEHADGEFTADVMAETLNRSSLGALAVGSRVNLERPMAARRAARRAHRPGPCRRHRRRSSSASPSENWEIVKISLPADLARYVVEKGSITVDGISLTVVDAGPDYFTVSLIPTTLALTTLGIKQPGDPVNLEVDVIAKYVERLLGHGRSRSGQDGDR